MEELQQKCPGLAIVPSKLVITRKAGGRGNFIHKEEEEEEDSLYAGGGDAVALRTCLIRAVQADWLAASLDIKTAFVNAMLPGEGSDEEVVVILQPPRLLVKLEYVRPDEFWVAVRAIYGLRQFPKLWGSHRDSRMKLMKWPGLGGEISLEPTAVDPTEEKKKKKNFVKMHTPPNERRTTKWHQRCQPHRSSPPTQGSK